MRSDNKRPFVCTGLAALSRLNVWWLRLGIQLERIAPGHPEQNGSHEQFHGVLKKATTRPPAANAEPTQHPTTNAQLPTRPTEPTAFFALDLRTGVAGG
jgi:transposase InsO family protein